MTEVILLLILLEFPWLVLTVILLTLVILSIGIGVFKK